MGRWLILLLALAPVQGLAQSVVTSPAPDSLSVTVYRDPDRGEGAINPRFPRGFALITEIRRIALPAGDATIRFEGVADGMIAVSAVVTGLPGGVIQKNRDARLLSPASLALSALGQSVHLRRTNPATGKVIEQDAIVRSSPNGALVIESAQGVEALRCSGLPETIVQDAVPPDLSVTPVLSVTTRSDRAVSADVTLTYLATGFDWGASYVARLGADRLDLFGWLTVANANSMSFPDARLAAVAGRLNRTSNYAALAQAPQASRLYLQCWPLPTYEGEGGDYAGAPPPPPPPPPPPAPMAMMARQDIVVTANRIARQEDLGDVKLYRVPMAVDIRASGQKQVALLHQGTIAITTLYQAHLAVDAVQDGPLTRIIRFVNRRESGAGVPLPAGAVTVFAQRGAEELLVAQSRLRDHAVGEKVELAAGDSAQRRYSQTGEGAYRHIILTNAADTSMTVEIALADNPAMPMQSPSHRLTRRDGQWLWTVTVPAHGTSRLDYRLRLPRK